MRISQPLFMGLHAESQARYAKSAHSHHYWLVASSAATAGITAGRMGPTCNVDDSVYRWTQLQETPRAG